MAVGGKHSQKSFSQHHGGKTRELNVLLVRTPRRGWTELISILVNIHLSVSVESNVSPVMEVTFLISLLRCLMSPADAPADASSTGYTTVKNTGHS